MSPHRLLRQTALHLALAVGALMIVLPFAWMILISLTPGDRIFSLEFWPSAFTLDNYRTAFEEVPIGRYYLNSIVTCGAVLALQLVVCTPAAFVLARMRLGRRDIGMWFILVCLLIPEQVVAVPTYLAFAKLDLIDTRTALILPFAANAFVVFLLRQFFLSIPQSVLDAARLDGAPMNTVLWRIVVPMARPAIAAFSIFSLVAHWNSYFWPLLALETKDNATIPFGIAQYVSDISGSDYGPQMAAATLTIVPLVVGFMFVQRHFVRGLALSNPD